MKLSLASWSLRECSLEEAAGIAKILRIGALDLGYFYRPALDKAALLAEPERMAERVRGLGVALPNLYHLFGAGLADRNLACPGTIEPNVADFAKIVRFCREAGIGTVFVLPGIVNPGQGRREALVRSAESLRRLLPIAQAANVTLTIEPHVHSFTESPTLVEELLALVPGLKLTLDYAHFTCLGYRQEEIDRLATHAAHVHLRQARPGFLQTKGEEGTINMEAQLGVLQQAGFQGYLALEFVHQDYMGTLHEDVLTETIRLRDRVLRWLA